MCPAANIAQLWVGRLVNRSIHGMDHIHCSFFLVIHTVSPSLLKCAGIIDIRFTLSCDSDCIRGPWIWTTYENSEYGSHRESPRMEHDLFYFRHHIFCIAEDRSCRSATPNYESKSKTTFNNLGSGHTSGHYCDCEHSDLCHDVHSTTRSLEALDGIEWRGKVQKYLDSH